MIQQPSQMRRKTLQMRQFALSTLASAFWRIGRRPAGALSLQLFPRCALAGSTVIGLTRS
jgi:hypothetical protein